ncbi:uncharacterized protein LOC127517971 isoform X4 [Ctenopharyngodon idella]|uniref:uncharacterized protein LOC127517971 isoform X4 n=1 Tax=Ctenopharyngodon idella TaxID=7959 RepID=UPI002230531D|nr:uncharacterized protein LOC127517971 isoform X4 [Ctenopharyngodon idella]
MKNLSKISLFLLIVCVFGADVERVSVMEGDSLTLDTRLREKFYRIKWRFGDSGSIIAEIDGNEASYTDDERFRDRLKLNDQTGSLTINNMRITDSGRYKVQIDHSDGTSYKTFSVTVHVSVMEGDSVTLNTEKHGITKVKWKFGDQVIAETFGKDKTILYPNPTERFRDRLKLNDQTGSLTINNMRITDSGRYEVQIDHSDGISYKTFSVTVHAVPGLSPGAKAGIVVVVLLLVLSAAAAAAVFYYRHRICDLKLLEAKISEQQSETVEERTVLVKEGDSVTLKTDAEIQRDDQILWTFGPQDSLIAETKSETGQIATYDGPDGRFRDRLKLDKTTGCLTISNIRSEHTGVYKLQTIGSRGTSCQRFIVIVRNKVVMISVVEGESVTLYPDTEVQKDDLIVWTFGYEDIRIAQMTGKTRETYEGTDGRFGDRLKVDKRTGSLTIKSTRTDHSGLYKLQMCSSSRATTNKRFKVAVNLKKISAKEGDTITLRTNTVVQRKDQLEWTFGDENSIIAEIKGGIGKISTFDIADGSFKDRLGLDEKTGSLTIKNTTAEHAGVYTLKLVTSKATAIRRCDVVVRMLKILGKKGNNVTLNPDTEIQRDDLILWMFGAEDNLIAQLIGETKETTYADADERFRDKLQLDKNTGSLTIRNITNGPYKLQIISSRRSLSRKFRVFMCCESGPKTVSGMMGECLILITDLNVESDEKVEWTFEDEIITTGMNGDSNKTSYCDDERFRDRLELHHQTGSLTIKNTRTSDTGVYQLKFCSRFGKNICWEFSVTVSGNSE